MPSANTHFLLRFGQRFTAAHTRKESERASFGMEGYDVTAARGFIDLFGLPMKVAQQAKRG